MKREVWMSDAGHASGERAATLDNAIQATRSSAARFADDAFLVALPLAKPAFVVAGLLGAFFASGALRAVALSVWRLSSSSSLRS